MKLNLFSIAWQTLSKTRGEYAKKVVGKQNTITILIYLYMCITIVTYDQKQIPLGVNLIMWNKTLYQDNIPNIVYVYHMLCY